MAKNSYFRDVNTENDLLHDLTIETIKIHGRDMVYIPRTLVNEDELFGEDTISKFENGVEIEMYIQSVDGFGGDGDFISKFGLEIRDTVELVVPREDSKNRLVMIQPSPDRERVILFSFLSLRDCLKLSLLNTKIHSTS